MTKEEAVAIAVAKRNRSHTGGTHIKTLSTGVKVRLVPVNPALIAEATSRIKDPPVPVFFNEQKGRDEPNPMSPDYERAIILADQERGVATMDICALMGVHLVDGLPEDTRWLHRLKILEKKGHIDLSIYDLEDGIDLHYLYCKHVAIGSGDWVTIFKTLGLTEEGIQGAAKFFPGEEGREPDPSGSSPQSD